MTDTGLLNPEPSGDLDIGNVVSTTFSVLKKEFALFAMMGGVIIGVPYLMYSLASMGVMRSAIANSTAGFSFTPIFWGGLGGIFMSILNLLLQAAVAHSTVQVLNEKETSLSDALGKALSKLLPLIVLSIFMGIAIGLGFLLLIVPGVILSIFWCVAVPSLVSEKIGVFDAFSRSSYLTKGQRWRIFGLFVVIGLINIVLGFVLNTLIGASSDPLAQYTFVGAVFTTLTSVVIGILSSIGVAVLYVKLRYLKEGADVSQISAVFD